MHVTRIPRQLYHFFGVMFFKILTNQPEMASFSLFNEWGLIRQSKEHVRFERNIYTMSDTYHWQEELMSRQLGKGIASVIE